MEKVLLLGPGPLTPEGGSSLPYLSFRTARVLSELGYEVVGIDSCEASLLSLPGCCSRFYLEPLCLEALEGVVERENPAAVVSNSAGVEGMYLTLTLAREGILQKGGLKVMGMPVEILQITQDRSLFKEVLMDANLPHPRFASAVSLLDGIKIQERIGFPLVIRPHFVMGGRGVARVCNREEYAEKLAKAINASPCREVTVEEDLTGWRQFICLLARDGAGDSRVLALIELLECAGIHSGDCLWIYPPQTLGGELVYFLEELASRMGHILGIKGIMEMEVLIHPRLEEVFVSEIFPGLGQTTLFASFATGRDLVKSNVLLSLGRSLHESVDLRTGRGEGPARVAARLPYWGSQTFMVPEGLTLSMERKSLGEQIVMGGDFDEMASRLWGFLSRVRRDLAPELPDGEPFLRLPADMKLFLVREWLKEGGRAAEQLPLDLPEWFYRLAKAAGDQVAPPLTSPEWGYSGERRGDRVLLLGGEPHHLGRGMEADVNVARALDELGRLGKQVFVYTENPVLAMISQDMGVPAVLGPYNLESILRHAREACCDEAITQFGGEMTLALTPQLMDGGLVVPGFPRKGAQFPSPRFRQLRLFEDMTGLVVAEGRFIGLEEALHWAEEMGYPQMVYTSRELASQRAIIVYSQDDLKSAFRVASGEGSSGIVMQPFCEDGTEVILEAVATPDGLRTLAFLENLEDHGVATDDCLLATPPLTLTEEQAERISERIAKVVEELGAAGNLRARVVVKGSSIRLEELYLGASSLLPLVGLVSGLPVQEWGIRALYGLPTEECGERSRTLAMAVRRTFIPRHIAEREDPPPLSLRRSSGAVGGMGWDLGSAFMKTYLEDLSSPTKGKRLFMSVANRDKRAAVMLAKELELMGYSILATSGTAEALAKGGVTARRIKKLKEGRPNVLDLIKNGEVDLIINTPRGKGPRSDGLYIRSAAASYSIPCLTNMSASTLLVEALTAWREGRLTYDPVQGCLWPEELTEGR